MPSGAVASPAMSRSFGHSLRRTYRSGSDGSGTWSEERGRQVACVCRGYSEANHQKTLLRGRCGILRSGCTRTICADTVGFDLACDGRACAETKDCIGQAHNPKAFWSPFPLPSLAMDDPLFVRSIPPNSWGGASQALTALRAPRWM